jgi:hypothetical protein
MCSSLKETCAYLLTTWPLSSVMTTHSRMAEIGLLLATSHSLARLRKLEQLRNGS